MKLRNIKNWLPALALVFATGCTDLDVDVKSQYTDDNFPVTAADMEALCGPVFTQMKGTMGRWYWNLQATATDEAIMVTNGDNWYDNGQYGAICLHTWDSSNYLMYDPWNAFFGGISQANAVTKILEAAEDSPEKTRYMAEMRAMRALYYFWAMDSYGDLPIIRQIGEDTPERSPRKEVTEFIVSELLACMDDLSTTVDETTYSKPTRYLACVLLAKIYLNWAVYTAADVSNYNPTDANPHWNDVVKYCDEIIAAGKYDLSDEWLSKFKEDNGPHIKDFIFAIPYDWVEDNKLNAGFSHARFWGHKFFEYTFGMNRSPSGPFRGIPSFVDKFNLPGDVRNNIWRGGKQYYEGTNTPYIYKVSKGALDNYYTGADRDEIVEWHFELTKELVIRGTGEQYNENLRRLNLGNDELGLAMGYRNMKFYPTLGSTTHWADNDFPVFRYADVLLMKAEAILRGATATNGDTPASLMNQVRDCAGAPRVTDVTLDELLDERAREFADENWRRNDLIRFGLFEEDWGLKTTELGTASKDKHRRIFPVPLNVMKLNTHWTQNPGYSNQ